MPLPPRVCDYFCVVGLENSETYNFDDEIEPQVLQRYPFEDFDDAEFPQGLASFCFPYNIKALNNPPSHGPRRRSFTLTEADGVGFFCTVLEFYMPYVYNPGNRDTFVIKATTGTENLPKTNSSSVLPSTPQMWDDDSISLRNAKTRSMSFSQQQWIPYALVITAHWTFFDQLYDFLKYLVSMITASEVRISKVSLEELIATLIYSTPLPPRGRITVSAKFFEDRKPIIFRRPPPNRPKDIPVSFMRTLYTTLSVNTIIQLLGLILREQRLLFVSEDLQLLNPVIESLCRLIYPFYWRHVYIPMLPKKMIDFTCTPMPFLIGIHSSYQPEFRLLEGVYVVNLDTDQVLRDPTDSNMEILPFPASKIMKYSKKRFHGIEPHSKLRSNQLGEDKMNGVLEDFERYFTKLLRTYKKHMNEQRERRSRGRCAIEKFNKDKFVQDVIENARDAKEKKWLNDFVDSQMFQCFIDDRYEIDDSSNNWDILYFDALVDQVLEKPAPFLVATQWEWTEIYHVECSDEEEKQQFTYGGGMPMPRLDSSLFGNPEKAKPLVSSEELMSSRREGGSTMNWISNESLEYFNQKRLFDRHWNSIRAREVKHTEIFVKLRQHFCGVMEYEAKNVEDLQRLWNDLKVLFEGPDINSGLTLDKGFASYQDYLKVCIDRRKIDRDICKEQVFVPFLEEVETKYRRLQAILQTASNWDHRTSKAKVQAEIAHNRWVRALKEDKVRQGNLEKKRDVKLLPKTVESAKSRNQGQLDYVEFTTDFLADLQMYKEKMPTLVEDARKSSGHRVGMFRNCMTKLVAQRKHSLETELAALKDFENSLEDVDPRKDVLSFQEGCERYTMTDLGMPGKDLERAKSDNYVKAILNLNTFEKQSVPLHARSLSTDSRKSSLPKAIPATSALFKGEYRPSMYGFMGSTGEIFPLQSMRGSTELKDVFKTDGKLRRNSWERFEVASKPNNGEIVEKTSLGATANQLDREKFIHHYSYYLWGPDGLNIVENQGKQGVEELKAFHRVLQDIANCYESRAKKILKNEGNLAFQLATSVVEQNVLKRLAYGMKQQSWIYQEAASEIVKISVPLQVLKSQLKRTFEVLHKQLQHLEAEYQKNDLLLKEAEAERDKKKSHYIQAQEAYQQVLKNTSFMEEVVPSLDNFSKCCSAYQHAEERFIFQKEVLANCILKRDICTGVVLDTYRDCEQLRQTKIVQALARLTYVSYDINRRITKMDDEVIKAVEMIDPKTAFLTIEGCDTSSSIKVNYVTVYEKVHKYCEGCLHALKSFIDFLSFTVDLEDLYVKNLPVEQVRRFNAGVPSLNKTFAQLSNFIATSSKLNCELLELLRTVLHEFTKAHQNFKKLFDDVDRLGTVENRIFSEKNVKAKKAYTESLKSRQQYDNISNKLQAELAKLARGEPDKKKGFVLFKKRGNTIEQLELRKKEARARLDSNLKFQHKVKSDLEKRRIIRQTANEQFIRDLKNQEESRLLIMRTLFSQVLRKKRDLLITNDQEISRMRDAGKEVNVIENLANFVRKNKTNKAVPSSVIQHLDLSRDLLNIEEKEPNFFDHVDKDYPEGVQPTIYVSSFHENEDSLEDKRLGYLSMRDSRRFLSFEKVELDENYAPRTETGVTPNVKCGNIILPSCLEDRSGEILEELQGKPLPIVPNLPGTPKSTFSLQGVSTVSTKKEIQSITLDKVFSAHSEVLKVDSPCHGTSAQLIQNTIVTETSPLSLDSGNSVKVLRSENSHEESINIGKSDSKSTKTEEAPSSICNIMLTSSISAEDLHDEEKKFPERSSDVKQSDSEATFSCNKKITPNMQAVQSSNDVPKVNPPHPLISYGVMKSDMTLSVTESVTDQRQTLN